MLDSKFMQKNAKSTDTIIKISNFFGKKAVKTQAKITKHELKFQNASQNYKTRAKTTKWEQKLQNASKNYITQAKITKWQKGLQKCEHGMACLK